MIKNKMLNIILVLVVLSLVLIGCSDNKQDVAGLQNSGVREEEIYDDDFDNYMENIKKEREEKERELTENIEARGEFTLDGRFVMFIKNNNDSIVNLDIEVEFYDKDGAFLGSEKEYLTAIKGKREVVVDTDIDLKASKYDLYVDAIESMDKEHFDVLSISHNVNGDKVLAQIKNNSEDIIDSIMATVVFYSEEKIVSADSGRDFDLKPGRTANIDFFVPHDKNYDEMKYDDYKIFITEAYSFDF